MVDVLIGIAPRDEFEGMIAGQLIAGHNAAMECYRRAMLGNQTFEGWRENLNQANKLSAPMTCCSRPSIGIRTVQNPASGVAQIIENRGMY